MRFTGGRCRGFDHVRIDSSLCQPLNVFQLQRFFVEHFNEYAADDLTFRFRIVLAFQRVEETLFAFNVNDVQAEMVTKHIHYLLGFVQAQQTVVDEHAGQVFSDCTVQQHRSHRGVNATGQTEDNFVIANLLTNAGNGVIDNFCRRPQRFTLADIAHKTLQHAHALTGVGNFRVELHAIEAFFFVRHDSKRAAVGAGNGHETFRNGSHFVAVAHPHIQQRFAVCGQGVFNTADKRAVGLHFNLRIAEFTFVRTFNMTTELHCHGLHAVAHAEHRHARIENVFRRTRAVFFSGTFRATGKNNTAWVEFANLCFRNIPCPQFTVDAQFTYATCNQLSVLRAKIEDENAMFMNIVCH